jgi:Flp pilus assembly pilin Flp
MATSGRIDRIRARCSRQEAQTMAEYAVILAVITPAIVAAYALFSGAIEPLIRQVIDFL